MSRTHSQYQRRRRSSPRLKMAELTTFGEAMDIAGQCECPMLISLGPVALINKRHRHTCPALKRRMASTDPNGEGGGPST
jgi:hypothetical protein